MRLEASGKSTQNKPMCHILNNPINCICEFTGITKGLQVAVITPILTAVQRVLNVFANCCINIAAGCFVIAERGIICINIVIIESKFSRSKSAAIANILVNTIDAQKSAVLSIGYEGRVNRHCAIIEFLTKCKPKA